MISTLPQHQPVDLQRSPIVLAVVQLRFPEILSVKTDESLIARYQDRIRDRYPYFLAGQQVEFLFGPQGVVQQPSQTSNWQFKDFEQKWTITVTASTITLETRHYTSISEFAGRMAEAVLAAKETFRIDVQQRVGLRYVNEIRHPEVAKPSDWRRFMNPTLLGPLADNAIAPSVESSIQELRLAASDGSLIVRHGAARGTTVAPEPGATVPTGDFYLLDLDAFDEKGRELDIEALDKLVKGYNRTIYSLFRWGMNDQLFGFLKGGEDD